MGGGVARGDTACFVVSVLPRARVTIACAAVAALAACSSDTTGPSTNRDPATARFVTEDIARFWVAFDDIDSESDTLPLRRDYLDAGTIGLRVFTERRWRNARTLTSMVYPRRNYYASIRNNSLQVAALTPGLRTIYERMLERYPPAVFPDVYFVIGGLGTGGTTSDTGLLIGVEMFSRAPNSPVDELTPWQQSVTQPLDVLPAIVAHELVHYQQAAGGNTLLAQAFREGAADFLSELLTGKKISPDRDAYGDLHEAELWREFEREMSGTQVSRWLYNGGTVEQGGRPADLGYYIGSRIAQAYYDRTADKAAAVRDIIRATDYAGLLRRSGYADRFPD